MDRQIIRTSNFVGEAARLVVDEAQNAIAERDEFRIALSGGNTPRPIYADLSTRNLPWNVIRITFGDERCVPPDDPESNFRMVRETLLAPAKVPEQSIMRMRGEIEPQVAAREYEGDLDTLAKHRGEDIYRHDLILLGLGDDGHTASLFPNTAGSEEQRRKVIANFVPKLNSWRLTFTFPLINHARHVCFLVGKNKSTDLIDRVIAGDPRFPASRVTPTAGELTWLIAR